MSSPKVEARHRAEGRGLWADNDPEAIAEALSTQEARVLAEVADWLDREATRIGHDECDHGHCEACACEARAADLREGSWRSV